MKTNFNDVGEFHDKFNLEHVSCNAEPCNGAAPGPRIVTRELIEFRLKFLLEELKETAEGLGYMLTWDEDGRPIFEKVGCTCADNIDHVKVFDGLLDLAYVDFGTAHVLGYPWQDGWEVVQRANMQKERALRAEQSARGSAYDVIKPKGWTPPDIAAVLRRHGFKV